MLNNVELNKILYKYNMDILRTHNYLSKASTDIIKNIIQNRLKKLGLFFYVKITIKKKNTKFLDVTSNEFYFKETYKLFFILLKPIEKDVLLGILRIKG